jgi:hypothetical protein
MDGLDLTVGQQFVEQAATDAEPVGGLLDREQQTLRTTIRGRRPSTAMSIAGASRRELVVGVRIGCRGGPAV